MTRKSLSSISCEFYPPKTEKGDERLIQVANELASLNPEFFSVTSGACGAERDKTPRIITALIENGNVPITPHITCIGSTKEELKTLMEHYKKQGIKHLVALRGDLPEEERGRSRDFKYANELILFIKENFGDHFHITVGAYPEIHPESKTAQQDLENFKLKIEAGADNAMTQFFFDADTYLRFIDRCHTAGIHIPITPGIVPLGNWQQILGFSKKCGAHFPPWLIEKFESFDDNEASQQYGLEMTTILCKKLLEAGAPGLHFYSLNHADLILNICKHL